jgi:hypothetical protein
MTFAMCPLLLNVCLPFEGECFGCCVDMKHPNDVEYKRGRPRITMPGLLCPNEAARAYVEEFAAVYDEAELKAQEARVRNEFKVMPPYLC